MKFSTLFTFIFILTFHSLQAQNLIEEYFEDATYPPTGWYYYPDAGGVSTRPIHTNSPGAIQGSLSLAIRRNNYIVTPILSDPNTLAFLYKRATSGSTQWKASVEILDASDNVIDQLPDVTAPNGTGKFVYNADLSSYQNIKIKITDIRGEQTGTNYSSQIDSFIVTQKEREVCKELFFSEYIEGSGNNKYLEIYNPSGQAVTLNDGTNNIYRVGIFTNGSTTVNPIYFSANSNIAANNVGVIGHSSATLYSGSLLVSSGSINFSGNDAVALQKFDGTDWINVDIIGKIGEDPGTSWTGGKGASTINKTLIRRPEVQYGININPVAGFPTLETEWLVYPIDENHGLGNHTSFCEYPNYVSIDSIASYRYCSEDSLRVYFTAQGNYPSNNIFTLEMSDSDNDYSSAIVLGSKALSGFNIHDQIIIPKPSGFSDNHFHLRITSNQLSVGNILSISTKETPIIKPNSAYYRSNKQNGVWTDASSWEVSTDSIHWENACDYPKFPIAKSTVIVANNFVMIPNSTTIDIGKLHVLKDATLALGTSTVRLNILNQEGVDFVVDGTFEDNSGSGGLTFPDFGTWLLGENGTIVKTGQSAVASNYRDRYEGGISNIPASATWVYRLSSDLLNTTNAGMYYPNLLLQKGGVGVGVRTYTMTSNSDIMTIKGDLTLGADVKLSYQNSNTSPAMVLGDLYISINSSISNVPTGTNTPGTGLNIYGNIYNYGQLVFNSNNVGVIQLSGDKTQNIINDNNQGNFDVRDLKITKQAQSEVVLVSGNIEVKHQLSLEGGIIRTNLSELYVSNPESSAITGYDTPDANGNYANDRYIVGKLKRAISNASSTYFFPIGTPPNDLGYNPSQLDITDVPDLNSIATAEFIHSFPGAINTYRTIDCNGESHFIEYRGLTNEGYWHYEGTPTIAYNIHLYPNKENSNILPNEDSPDGYKENYRALKEDVSKVGGQWSPDAASLGDPCIVSNNYYDIIGAGYSGFSIFAPGGGSGSTTALPIELINFDINCNDNPSLQWSTASEINTKVYRIEGSNDAIHFSPISEVKAAGNSSQLTYYTYTLLENELFDFYRLVEVDWDNSVFYHKIIDNSCQILTAKKSIYYHPRVGIQIPVQIGHQALNVQVYDALGKLVYQKNISSPSESLNIPEANMWTNGIYVVNVLYQNMNAVNKKILIY
ncbi:MAG: T9SS type A sorting domain-containing protein [Chitinophagales bacterium]|nr:T9SS type A sorting domain-containing protein [Chitinophagales bacterium]